MFERFTEEARQTLVLSEKEARGLGHGYIGTEHLLLGLIGEGAGPAGRAFAKARRPPRRRARAGGSRRAPERRASGTPSAPLHAAREGDARGRAPAGPRP